MSIMEEFKLSEKKVLIWQWKYKNKRKICHPEIDSILQVEYKVNRRNETHIHDLVYMYV